MAILIDFEKVSDDEREVEYRFGYPTMDRRLVIDKETGDGRPLDGLANHGFAAVYVKLTRMFRESGDWPSKGMYAA
jgi:hypothetical protein